MNPAFKHILEFPHEDAFHSGRSSRPSIKNKTQLGGATVWIDPQSEREGGNIQQRNSFTPVENPESSPVHNPDVSPGFITSPAIVQSRRSYGLNSNKAEQWRSSTVTTLVILQSNGDSIWIACE